MRPLLAFIRKEFLAMRRDVHGLLVLFAMPAVFILIMSLALRDTFRPTVAEKIHWQAWDGDGSPQSLALLAHLPPPEHNVTVHSPEELNHALDRNLIQIGVRIAPGYGEALANPENQTSHLALDVDTRVPPSLVAAFRAELTRAYIAERIGTLLRPLQGASDEAAGFPEWHQLAEGEPVAVAFHRSAQTSLTAVQQSVPAWLVFAMFFVVIPLSTIFIAERQQGTLPRLRTLAVSPTTILAGKIVPFYLMNLVQTGLMLLIGRFAVPWLGGDALSLEIDWLALWAMASAVSLAAIGFALAVAATVRTTEQATTIGGVANILFGALGGIMVPKLVMPAAMQSLTRLSPMAWGLEGFQDIFAREAHLGQVLPYIGGLLFFALVGVAFAGWRLRGAR